MTILTILVIIQNTQNKTYNLAIFVSGKEKINERLSELKTWLLSCKHPLAFIGKIF